MCDFGISESIVASVVMAVTSAAISASTSIVAAAQQAKSLQAQYDYQAQIAQRNAKIAQQNASQKRQEGIEEAREKRIQTAQRIGLQRATMAAGGIDSTQGSALDVLEDTAMIGELDAQKTLYNKESQAIALEETAKNYNNQANLDTFASQNAIQSGRV